MRKDLILIVLCLTMFFGVAPSVSAQVPNDEYKAALGQMLELSGSMKTAKSMLPQIIDMIKKQSPSVDSTLWDSYQKKWEEKFGNRLVELYAPIYYKYLTLADLKEIVVFYESPVGKKMGASSSAMMAESMQMGQKLGMDIFAEIQEDLKAVGNK